MEPGVNYMSSIHFVMHLHFLTNTLMFQNQTKKVKVKMRYSLHVMGLSCHTH